MKMAVQGDTDEDRQLANIASVQQILRNCLEKSREISSAIEEAGPRLERSRLRLASLEATVRALASNCALFGIRRHVNGALGPADSVVRIFDVVCDLQSSLMSPPSDDLGAYISTIDRIEEAVRLLGDSCKLLILWLEDALHYLEGSRPVSNIDGKCDWYITKINKCLHILRQLEATGGQSILGHDLFMEALHHLENEFRRLLLSPDDICPTRTSTDFDDDDEIIVSCPTSYPLIVMDKMDVIIDRLIAMEHLDKCMSIYVEVRSSTVKTALRSIDLDYLRTLLSKLDSVQIVQGSIDQWCKHLQVVVKYVLEEEYRLCCEVFGKAGSDVWQDCFAKIVLHSGFYCDFIEFGKMITRAKKDAIKLLKLLDIFSALNKLRPDFNRLFSGNGEACLQIQAQTRELINNIIKVSCEIFWELSIQVESQRRTSPPLDGSVPRIVRFVTEFCNLMLEDDRRSALVEVLRINQAWNNCEFNEGLVSNQVHYVMKDLELNLEAWAKAYEDTTFSHFFFMNSSWSLCKSIKGTKLGNLMGKDWLRNHEERAEHHMAAYLEESWEKLPSLLEEDGLILFPGGRAIDHKLLQKRLRDFKMAFEQMYRKQSTWFLSDKDFRLRTHRLILQVIIPPYNNYMSKYMPEMAGDHEEGAILSKFPESLEKMIYSLFQTKLDKSGSTKSMGLAGKIRNNPVTSHFPSSHAGVRTLEGSISSSPAAA